MDEVEWVVVTGCTQGIGKSITAAIAMAQWGVVLVCRDVKRGDATAQELRHTSGNTHIQCEVADLSSFEDVVSLRQRLAAAGLRLRALVNNAAECPRQRQQTPRGLERQLATNVLGYHWMIRELAPLLQSTAQATSIPSRVVNVASHWAGDLDLDDLGFHHRTYDNDTAYRQSKQADRMLTVTWAEKLAPSVLVNACHPGDPCTTLSCALGYNMHSTKDCSKAAQVPTFLAVDPLVAEQRWTGRWFDSKSPTACQFAGKGYAAVRNQLFEKCEAYST